MSIALDSLMHALPGPQERRRRGGGVLRFIGVGGLGALAFVVLSSGLMALNTGIADWIVTTLSWAALIVPVYLLHHRFSFASPARHRQALPRYFATQIMALVLAAAFSFGALEVLALPALLASVVVVVLTASVNYVVLRSWAFASGRGGVAPAK